LCNRLARKKFTFAPAKGIPIPKAGADGKKDKTKFRPIVLAPLESRIVQRSVLETLTSLSGMQGYINIPYSFGGIRKSKDAQQAAVALRRVLSLDSTPFLLSTWRLILDLSLLESGWTPKPLLSWT
jgi:hypothetical protein